MRRALLGLMLLATGGCTDKPPPSSVTTAVSLSPPESVAPSPPTPTRRDDPPPVYGLLRIPKAVLEEAAIIVGEEPTVAPIVEACRLDLGGIERIDAAVVPPDALRVAVLGKGATATAIRCVLEKLGVAADLAIDAVDGGVRIATRHGLDEAAGKAFSLFAARPKDDVVARARIGLHPPWTVELTTDAATEEPVLLFRSTDEAASVLYAWWAAAQREKGTEVPQMKQLVLERDGDTVRLRMVGDTWADMQKTMALALAMRRHVFEPFNVPSRSMLPSLVVDDHFFVDKTGPPPGRGDIVVFPFPDNPSQRFVKRFIAGPGDRLEVIDGRPIVNGKLLPHCHVGRTTIPGAPDRLEIYVEYLGERAYLTAYDEPPTVDTCSRDADCDGAMGCRAGRCGLVQGPYQSTDGAWVLGDNRNNSHDSRSFSGGRGVAIPMRELQGRATLIYYHPTAMDRALTSVDAPRLPVEDPGAEARLKACLAKRPSVAEATPPSR